MQVLRVRAHEDAGAAAPRAGMAIARRRRMRASRTMTRDVIIVRAYA
jgi:hypothetical protein